MNWNVSQNSYINSDFRLRNTLARKYDYEFTINFTNFEKIQNLDENEKNELSDNFESIIQINIDKNFNFENNNENIEEKNSTLKFLNYESEKLENSSYKIKITSSISLEGEILNFSLNETKRENFNNVLNSTEKSIFAVVKKVQIVINNEEGTINLISKITKNLEENSTLKTILSVAYIMGLLTPICGLNLASFVTIFFSLLKFFSKAYYLNLKFGKIFTAFLAALANLEGVLEIFNIQQGKVSTFPYLGKISDSKEYTNMFDSIPVTLFMFFSFEVLNLIFLIGKKLKWIKKKNGFFSFFLKIRRNFVRFEFVNLGFYSLVTLISLRNVWSYKEVLAYIAAIVLIVRLLVFLKNKKKTEFENGKKILRKIFAFLVVVCTSQTSPKATAVLILGIILVSIYQKILDSKIIYKNQGLILLIKVYLQELFFAYFGLYVLLNSFFDEKISQSLESSNCFGILFLLILQVFYGIFRFIWIYWLVSILEKRLFNFEDFKKMLKKREKKIVIPKLIKDSERIQLKDKEENNNEKKSSVEKKKDWRAKRSRRKEDKPRGQEQDRKRKQQVFVKDKRKRRRRWESLKKSRVMNRFRGNQGKKMGDG